ncbi:ParB/RepB/Spo0J family partition protein [Streptomyces sp. NPDC020719]|uniref:ParB/RepB/Spo0J family partition protein n=1 Tax=Streptomyces sp. NPDC020719 TaxID=3154896 RepID=UPI0034073062
MSKSDLLGAGASFSNARRSGRSERGRAKAIAQGDLPEYELVRLPLERVATTPLNPRRNFGTEEEMTNFGEELREAQLSACVAVSRRVYLALWPDHEQRIGAAEYVLINGERRYRCAVHVGLDALDFVVRDDLASSREDFIDNLLAENLEREDFDVIERARGVQQLVTVCAEEREHGAKSRAAKRLRKSPAWVTQQLMLLELPVAIQTLLSSGDLPERDGRFLAGAAKEAPDLTPEALLELLRERKAAEAEKRAQEKEILAAHKGSASVTGSTGQPFTAVKDSEGVQEQDESPTLELQVPLQPESGPAVAAKPTLAEAPLPEPRGAEEAAKPEASPAAALASPRPPRTDGDASAATVRPQVKMPWRDPDGVAQIVISRMTRSDRQRLRELLEKQEELETRTAAATNA